MTSEVTLEFLQRQQERILDELATMRIEHRATLQAVRDDMGVLTASVGVLRAMMQGIENANRNQQQINTLILDRLSKLAEPRP
jgi:uncharacterized coiled-coil protein SlyX